MGDYVNFSDISKFQTLSHADTDGPDPNLLAQYPNYSDYGTQYPQYQPPQQQSKSTSSTFSVAPFFLMRRRIGQPMSSTNRFSAVTQPSSKTIPSGNSVIPTNAPTVPDVSLVVTPSSINPYGSTSLEYNVEGILNNPSYIDPQIGPGTLYTGQTYDSYVEFDFGY